MKSESRIIYYIKTYKDKNYTNKHIRNLLADKGYTQNDIKHGFEEFESMDFIDEDKMVAYVEKHVRQGHNVDKIVTHLLDKGYERDMIQRAVLRAKIHTDQQEFEQKEEQEPQAEITTKKFDWNDALILFPVTASIITAFFNVLAPFAAIILLSTYLLRFMGVNPLPLGHTCLISGSIFLVLAALVDPSGLSVATGCYLLVTSFLLFMHRPEKK